MSGKRQKLFNLNRVGICVSPFVYLTDFAVLLDVKGQLKYGMKKQPVLRLLLELFTSERCPDSVAQLAVVIKSINIHRRAKLRRCSDREANIYVHTAPSHAHTPLFSFFLKHVQVCVMRKCSGRGSAAAISLTHTLKCSL